MPVKRKCSATEEVVKSKMVPADRVYHRLIWDDRLPVADFDLGYEDRFKGIMFMPLTRFRHTGDETSEIPFHRVRLYRYKGEVIWDRENRIDNVDRFFDELGEANEVRATSALLRSTMRGADAVHILRPRAFVDDEMTTPVDGQDAEKSGAHASDADADAGDDLTQDGAASLRIATFNVLFDRFNADNIYTPWRVPLIVAELEAVDADIIGLQEVTGDMMHQLRRASPALRQRYFWTAVPNDVPSSQVILSRHPITECVSISLSKNKRAIFAVVEVEGVPVVVCVCHLVSDFAGGAAVGRRVEELKTILGHLNLHPLAILMGDFNFGDQSPEPRMVQWGPFTDCYRATRTSSPASIASTLTKKAAAHTTGVQVDPDNVEAVAVREGRSLGGYTFDVLHNDLAALTSTFNVYNRRLDRLFVKGMVPRDVHLFAQEGVKTTVPVNLPKSKSEMKHSGKKGKGSAHGAPPPAGDDDADHANDDEPFTLPAVKGPTKEILLFPSDHYGVVANVVVDLTKTASAASPVVNTGMPDMTLLEPFFPCFQTALCILPPSELNEKINAIRAKYDSGYPRWMAHINVMHPFITPARLSEAIDVVNQLLIPFARKPIAVHLRRTSFFDARKKLVFIDPEFDSDDEKARLRELHSRLQDCLPACRKDKVDAHGYNPHLTLGHVEKSQLNALQTLFDELWTPTSFTLSEMYVLGLLDGAEKYQILHRFDFAEVLAQAAKADEGDGGEDTPHRDTVRGAGQAYFSTPAIATEMILEGPSWGTRRLPSYTPDDALEKWMLHVTVPSYARDAPTHISQRGAMYHIPSNRIDDYLTHWQTSYEQSEQIPFFMEEVRGSPFRLYVDLDLKSTQPEPIDATMVIPFIVSVAKEVFGLDASEAEDDAASVLSMQCHGAWEDQQHSDARFKSGYRLYFQHLFVDTPTYSAFLRVLGQRLQADEMCRLTLMNPETTPRGMTWEEVCDTKATSWDRGRLVGTIKRRRHLLRRYELHGIFDAHGINVDRTCAYSEDLRRVLYGTTLRLWETVPTDGVAMGNEFTVDRLKTCLAKKV